MFEPFYAPLAIPLCCMPVLLLLQGLLGESSVTGRKSSKDAGHVLASGGVGEVEAWLPFVVQGLYGLEFWVRV